MEPQLSSSSVQDAYNTINSASFSQRTSLSFNVVNRVGVLKECLEVFSNCGVSLAQIVSKPCINSGYDFFVEIDSEVPEDKLQNIVHELEASSKCTKVTVMGQQDFGMIYIHDIDIAIALFTSNNN